MPLDFARLSPADLAPARRGSNDHFVQLYEHDDALIDSVAMFADRSLEAGGAAVLIATPSHRMAVRSILSARGHDLDELSRSDRFFSLDAGQVLATFTVEEKLDRNRFRNVVGGLIHRAAAAGRRVHAFGEMVALLWDRGDVAGAIELEELWNELAETQPFDLFCAYPVTAFGEEDLSLLGAVCERHSHVLPPA